MSQKFIDQVRAIVMNNISDEKFGVHELASTLGLSSSQTLRKVKAATGKSVNQYIRELRLEKAAKLIKKTDLTIAEISYQVGFGSPSYFNKTFVNYYGIAPGEYKTKSISLSVLAVKAIKNKHRETSLKMKIFYPVIIVLVFVIGYLLINNSSSKKTSFENSIAVLPFKDMSPDDTQWFCDGVSDNILHSLSQIKDLTVISFTSSSTFRDSDKQISEIAKELGVSYILEGSVTLIEDKIKVIAQLIDANDQHVWSKEYNDSFDNVIAVQKNVAYEVMKQLEITLNPQEEIALATYPTQNMEAYNLHLKGRLINGSRALKDLEANIELNKQAIALDSNFVEAYAEVAHSFYLLSHRYSVLLDPFETRESANYFADMALEIDSNNIKALGVKTSLLFFVDWDKSKEYIEKSIALNPNEVISQKDYSIYFLFGPKPDIKKYLMHAEIAQRLDPLSTVAAGNYLIALIINNKLEEAEEQLEKKGFLFSKYGILLYKAVLIAYKNKDWTPAFAFLESKIEKEPNNILNYISLGDHFNGINDKISALKYWKKGYEIDSTNSGILNKYLYGLTQAKKFNEAKKLMASKNYKSIVIGRNHKFDLFEYYYFQEDYKKALEISKDSLFNNQYWFLTLSYAQLGDRKKVDSMNKKYPWGTGRLSDWRFRRAILHAALKDKDSTYYFLENIMTPYFRGYANSRPEFDIYRNEQRFKAILKKWNYPVPGE
jgi:TolB-like protein/AraC-like DNA-binding protein